jgi:hypothetical protein
LISFFGVYARLRPQFCVDTFSALQICVNYGSQYTGVVLASAAGNFSDLSMKSLVEPILGLGTSYQFVRSAASAAERRQRIATLAAFFAASGAALTTDPTTNVAMGSVITSNIAYMQAVMLSRGGSSQIPKTFLLKDFAMVAKVHPPRTKFTESSKIIIENMFEDRKINRYLAATSVGKYKYIALITASNQLNISLIGLTVCSIGVTIFIILAGLYLFQRSERKEYFRIRSENILCDRHISMTY